MQQLFFIENFWLILVLILWTLPWKGLALWKAANLKAKWWFAALLIINTFGLLEIIYIFIISRRKDEGLSTTQI